ncbi:TIGR02680 family protein [Nocardia thailandica]
MTSYRPLPQPVSARWKPLRAGLADIFYYDEQEFPFRDGRLLLRGNNGAGKSKVLALLLPFLLDGDLSPHRVEPDADPRKRMEWNLLLGGAHPHTERIGYTWLEFGRVDPDGTPHFRTIGCGLKAVRGRGIASHWFFVSSGRVGAELRLVGEQGYPVARDRLGEQLQGNGERYDTALAYRRAVDENLFGLGELRYGALVDLLIQLRQPQLSKKPSEKVLSQALTESLPPIDQAILADVAEAFRSLQEDRDELQEMKAALSGTDTFLRQYREYAGVAARRQTTRLRQAHSRYEQVGRDMNEAKAAFEVATDAETRLRAQQQSAEDEHERLTVHRQSLNDSAAAGAARELQRSRAAAEQARADDRSRRKDLAEATASADRDAAELAEAAAAVEHSAEALAAAGTEAAHQAARAALTAAHSAEVAGPLEQIATGTTASGADPVPALRAVTDALVVRHTAAIRQVRARITAADEATAEVRRGRTRLDRIDTARAEHATAAVDAERRIRSAAADFGSTTADYLRGTSELTLPEQAALLDDLGDWALIPAGLSPVAAATLAFVTARREEFARADAALDARETAVTATRRDLETELNRLRRGGIEHPPARYTRAVPAGENPGAPLWQLITFGDQVAEPDRAGVEAALEAAGILDAWVHPDGVLRTGTGEVVVTGDMPAPGRTLSSITGPDIDTTDPRAAAVSAATVTAVLSAIGLGATSGHHTWVDPSGRFRLGVLDGAWHKPSAQFIGATARERFRRDRIAVLEAELEQCVDQLTELTAQRARLADRAALLSAEAAGLPTDEQVQAAHRHAAEVERRGRQLTADHAEAAAELAAAEAAAERALTDLDRDAGDAGLPVTVQALDTITESLTEYRLALGTVWSAIQRSRDAHLRQSRAAENDARARERLVDRAEAAEQARLEVLRAEERFRTLDANVGAEVEELRENLARNSHDLTANASLRTQLSTELGAALRAIGVAEGKLSELTALLDQERYTRDTAVTELARFAATGLFAIAVPEIGLPAGEPWSAAAAIAFARAADTALSEVAEDDKSLDRAQHRVTEEHKRLADLLSAQGNSAAITFRDNGIVAEVGFRGRTMTVSELAATLDREVGDRDRLLTEREREILENHLVDEVAAALQDLILAAETQVARMNDELESRPTSTGMRLRLRWVPSGDAPVGAKPALAQLRRRADVWNSEDRAAVGEFLQREIDRVRTADTADTWLEHLTTAFDYRRWNTFVIELQQRGQWRPAVGPASGGERVLAASVPLFAAASAHYASATDPHAPRLVMLDEAFAGVDDNARAKYLGLLAAFDLDVVMTSEREWGCYPEVPGLAIAQLARTDDVDAVLVTQWEWDGTTRHRVDPVPPTAATSAAISEPGGLF